MSMSELGSKESEEEEEEEDREVLRLGRRWEYKKGSGWKCITAAGCL